MNDPSLRERLCQQESKSPQLEERFQKELRAMMERKLKPFERVMWTISTLIGASFVPLFIYISVIGLHARRCRFERASVRRRFSARSGPC